MSASAPKVPLSSSSKAKARSNKSEYNDRQKETDIRTSNLIAAKAIQDLIRTSLGPRGMDKMISSPNGENIITNDGATIMQKLKVRHPAAKMLVEMSKSQDIEAGDGTTSVVVLAGSLLGSCLQLINKGIHATRISESFQKALKKTEEILTEMAIPIDLSDREALIKSASTSLNSKVVSHYSSILAPLAVDAVLRVIDPATATNVELRDIHVVKKVGGTLEDTELVDGLIFPQGLSRDSLTPSKVANAKIALIQFCISPPKTYMDNSIVITDYTEMDRVLKEERDYILNICKKVKASGCNVLLIQKSILRDAASDLALHFLAKLKILVVTDIERTEIEFITKTIGCTPIASIEAFTADKLGTAKLVEEVSTGEGRIVKVTGVPNTGKTVSVLCRGSSQQLVDEVERSVHDALCVVRSLVKKRHMIVGGGAPEIECSIQLANYAKTLPGVEGICIRAFAEALEVIPYTLAENAGLNPIVIVTELRNRHVQGEKHAGINVKKGTISDIYKENVVQPLLVSTSAITLATETTTMILKIDDVVLTR